MRPILYLSRWVYLYAPKPGCGMCREMRKRVQLRCHLYLLLHGPWPRLRGVEMCQLQLE